MVLNYPSHTPPQTLAFQRVIQRAVLHSEYSSAKSLSVGDLIAAIYTENESHACYYLHQEGIERLDILDYISHGPRIEYQEEAEIDELFDSKDNYDDEYMGEDEDGEKPKSVNDICEDLTKAALEGKLDPLIGREKEMDQLLHILSRRLKNNPLLVGDQGVGKTAIVEGLAIKIVNKKCTQIVIRLSSSFT